MKSIFISHINEEAPLASTLKEWLESTFPGMCKVFVSSDPSDLPVGTKWLDCIDCALRDAEVLLVLCSPASLPRPWINFEAGCAWMKKISIIPICHTGITVNILPLPLSEFHALNLESSNFVNQLIEGVGRQLGISKFPRIDTKAMRRSLTIAQKAIQMSISPVKGQKKDAGHAILLNKTVMDILKTIVNTAGAGIFESELRKKMSLKTEKLTYYLEKLADAGFIIGNLVKERPNNRPDEWLYCATKHGRHHILDVEEN